MTPAEHCLFPQTGKTKALAYTTANTQLTLTGVTGFTDVDKGNTYVALLLTTDAQVAFGSSAVTIAADDPVFKADTIIDRIPPGGYVAVKAATTSGTAYFWVSS